MSIVPNFGLELLDDQSTRLVNLLSPDASLRNRGNFDARAIYI